MSYNPNQPRNAKGAPMAGAWAQDVHRGSAAPASQDRRIDFNERVELDKLVRVLEGEGYIESKALFSLTDPRSATGIDSWHGQAFIAAPYSAEVESDRNYPVIPQDYNSTKSGRSINGLRRAPRMRYQDSEGDTVLRMMSATNIRRYAQEVGDGKPFLVPVEIDTDGKTSIGYVRVSHLGQGVYTSVPEPGFPSAAAQRVGDSVCAVLEARRPRAALDSMDTIIAARQRKFHAAGTMLQPVRSEFISGAGYNKRSGELVMQMQDSRGNARSYAYQNIPEEAWKRFEADPHPGKAYNRLIRGKYGQAVKNVEQCALCNAFHSVGNQHRCLARSVSKGYRTENSSNRSLNIMAMAGAEKQALTGQLNERLDAKKTAPAKEPSGGGRMRRLGQTLLGRNR